MKKLRVTLQSITALSACSTIRTGEAADDENWALSGFNEEFKIKLNAVIN